MRRRTLGLTMGTLAVIVIVAGFLLQRGSGPRLRR